VTSRPWLRRLASAASVPPCSSFCTSRSASPAAFPNLVSRHFASILVLDSSRLRSREGVMPSTFVQTSRRGTGSDRWSTPDVAVEGLRDPRRAPCGILATGCRSQTAERSTPSIVTAVRPEFLVRLPPRWSRPLRSSSILFWISATLTRARSVGVPSSPGPPRSHRWA